MKTPRTSAHQSLSITTALYRVATDGEVIPQLYFFHYTNKSACDNITGANCATAVPQEDWTCKTGQPQKWMNWKDQHPEGFYVGPFAPNQLSSKTIRKMGGGSDGDYVLVFDLPVSASDFSGGKSPKLNNGKMRISQVGKPGKFVIQPIGNSKNADSIPFTDEMLYWAGKKDAYALETNTPEELKSLELAKAAQWKK